VGGAMFAVMSIVIVRKRDHKIWAALQSIACTIFLGFSGFFSTTSLMVDLCWASMTVVAAALLISLTKLNESGDERN
jgi:hypothetical protein